MMNSRNGRLRQQPPYLRLTCVMLTAMLAACGSPATVKVPTTIPSSTPNKLVVLTATLEPDPTATPLPPKGEADAVCASVSAPPPAVGLAKIPAVPKVSFITKDNTIVVSAGDPTDLPSVSRVLNQPQLLSETAPGEWLLSANLRVDKGASLVIAGPDVRRLKLRSTGTTFTWVKAVGGRLEIGYTCVTSWDPTLNTVAASNNNGRSFVLARDNADLYIHDSELSYLGYDASESYGVAIRLGSTGKIINNKLGYNFYGLYTYAVSDIVIRGNEVHHSIRYGIDPHTRSNRLLIESNTAHHNGKQGLILAEDCTNSVIRNNIVFSNTMNGIELFQDSDNNLVEGNTAYGNGQLGINVNNAFTNTVRGNTVYNNNTSGIGVGQGSANNIVISNTVRGNSENGIYVFGDARRNTIGGNTISGNSRYGIYVRSDDNKITDGNTIFENAIGIYLRIANAPAVSRDTNHIYNNRVADVRSGTE